MVAELGGAAMHSGLQTRGLPGHRGRLTPDQLRAGELRPKAASTGRGRRSWRSRTRTTAPAAPSGRSRSSARCVRDGPRARPAVHLDGARLVNAAVASGVPAVGDRRPRFDTVTLCLSKGLGCPLGAVIAGSHELMLELASRSTASAGRCARPGSSLPRGSTRSTTTSSVSPTTTRGPAARRRLGRSRSVPSTPSSSRRTSCR